MATKTMLPKNIQKRRAETPNCLGRDEKKFFKEIEEEFSDLGIDTFRFKRALMELAKDLALEHRLEKDLKAISGSVTYESDGGATPFKEHPSAKHLQTVRARIMHSLKSFGLLPTAKAAKASTESKVSPFAAIGK